LALGLLLAAMSAAPAALAGDPCFHSSDNRPPSSTGATTAVSIADCTFGPTVAYAPVGAQIVWRNASSQAHEVVGANLEWGAHEKLLEPGDTIGWSFQQAGVYAYSCMLHPGMTGAIVVGDGAATRDAAMGAAAGSNAAPTASAVGPSTGADGGLVLAGLVGGVGLAAAIGVLVVVRSRQPLAE
jgi:plastocyanin